MSMIPYTGDSLRSLVSGLGDPFRDKMASVYYAPRSWTDQDLFNAYRASWIARKMIDIPAKDATREWRNWQATGDQITAIEAEESRLDVRRKVQEAIADARLFGGSALYIGIEGQDPAEPLDVGAVRRQGIAYLTPLGRREISPGQVERDIASEFYGRPAYYEIVGTRSGVRIHPSRLAIFKGVDLPCLLDESGWGDSVLVSAMATIQQTDSVAANIASLVFEAKVDIIGVPGLLHEVSDPVYEQRLLKRFGLAAVGKGINGMLLLDKDETFESKTISFTGLPEVLSMFLTLVSGAADIPATRFIGRSPAGLNANGRGDLENYYDRIRAIQTTQIEPALSRLDECLIRSALGSRPQSVRFRWGSLWQVSEKERAEIGSLNAEMLEKLSGTGLFPPEALANAGTNLLVKNGIMPGLDQSMKRRARA